jgi:hypothetical protein
MFAPPEIEMLTAYKTASINSWFQSAVKRTTGRGKGVPYRILTFAAAMPEFTLFNQGFF